jgi:H+/Cl- antiporter ClcA
VPDPVALIRSRQYVVLLVVATVVGAPMAVVAYFFLKLLGLIQQWVFTDLPKDLGYGSPPDWWPLLPLAVAGLLVGLIIRFLPGKGGETPVEGFKPGTTPSPVALPGIVLAALASIGLGAVIGPEGPLVAIGGGVAYFIAGRLRRMPEQGRRVVVASGSFASISTLFGTPLAASFLLLEASGLAGATATAVLLPGLLAAGIGALIFTGLDSLTGFGTFSFAIPHLPAATAPTGAEFGYALAFGVVAALLATTLRRAARGVEAIVSAAILPLTIGVGLAMAGLAIAYHAATGHATSDVLFSGQVALPTLVEHASGYSVGALLMLLLCKGVAYTGALGSFRGGPTFPAMFLGAAGGVLAAHLPGLTLPAGVAMGLGAMTTGILRLPFVSVLLATLVLGSDGFPVIPLTIVAVVVCHVVTARLTPAPA